MCKVLKEYFQERKCLTKLFFAKHVLVHVLKGCKKVGNIKNLKKCRKQAKWKILSNILSQTQQRPI